MRRNTEIITIYNNYSIFIPTFNYIISQLPLLGEGFTTFDLADIYGPAEDYVGAFSKGRLSNSNSRECQFLTKWVPRPEQITRKMATDAIDRSLMRMKSERLDLLQFHW